MWLGFSLAPSPRPQTQRSRPGSFTCGFLWGFLPFPIIYLFIFGCAGCSLLRGLSLAAASGGCPLAAVCGLLIAVAPLLQSRGPGARGLQ